MALDDPSIAKQIVAALEKLAPDCLDVVTSLFGLSGRDPNSADEIGARLGVTTRDVEEIEADALRALANYGPRAVNKPVPDWSKN